MAQITLRAARVNAGYSLKKASKEAQVPESTLYRWESDISRIPAKAFLNLCNMYKIDVYDIFLP